MEHVFASLMFETWRSVYRGLTVVKRDRMIQKRLEAISVVWIRVGGSLSCNNRGNQATNIYCFLCIRNCDVWCIGWDVKDSYESSKRKMAGELLGLRCQNGQYSEMQVKKQDFEGNGRDQSGCSRELKCEREESRQISPKCLCDVESFTWRAKGMVLSRGIRAVMWRTESRKGRICMKRPSGTMRLGEIGRSNWN